MIPKLKIAPFITISMFFLITLYTGAYQVQVRDDSKVPPEAVQDEEHEEGGVHADQGDQQEVERVAHVLPEKKQKKGAFLCS